MGLVVLVVFFAVVVVAVVAVVVVAAVVFGWAASIGCSGALVFLGQLLAVVVVLWFVRGSVVWVGASSSALIAWLADLRWSGVVICWVGLLGRCDDMIARTASGA